MAKKIGVLTSGGDAPGMNAAVRAVCRAGLAKGMEVVGILRGYNGLLNGEVIEMNARTVSGIIQRGGTCLYTARCPEFRDIEGVKKGSKTVMLTGDAEPVAKAVSAQLGLDEYHAGLLPGDTAASAYRRPSSLP